MKSNTRWLHPCWHGLLILLPFTLRKVSSPGASPEGTFGSEIFNSNSVDPLERDLHVLHELRQTCHLCFYRIEAGMLGPCTSQLCRMIHVKAIGKMEQRQGARCSGLQGFHGQVLSVENSPTF